MSVSPAGHTSRLGRRLAAAHYYRTYSPTRLQVGSKISMHPLPLRVRKQLVLASSSTLEKLHAGHAFPMSPIIHGDANPTPRGDANPTPRPASELITQRVLRRQSSSLGSFQNQNGRGCTSSVSSGARRLNAAAIRLPRRADISSGGSGQHGRASLSLSGDVFTYTHFVTMDY